MQAALERFNAEDSNASLGRNHPIFGDFLDKLSILPIHLSPGVDTVFEEPDRLCLSFRDDVATERVMEAYDHVLAVPGIAERRRLRLDI